MTAELENELKILVLASCQECRTFNYHPTKFEDMIYKYGVVEAIKKVVDKTAPTIGFNRLKEEVRLDLSAEALILKNPKFRKLFTDDLLKIADERLKKHGYELKVKTKDKKVCPECGYVFQGKGWTGIDAHWKSKHKGIMSYEEAWALIQAGKYKKQAKK